MEQSLISWLKDFWGDEHGAYRYCNDVNYLIGFY